MQVQNSYYWFKSALTPEQCQKIIDLGVSEIERVKKAGGRTDATTFGNNDKLSMKEKGLDVKPQADKTIEELKKETGKEGREVEEEKYVRDSEVSWLNS